MTIRTATAVIDRQALLHNYQTIKAKAPHSQILAVLKANGYGHGLERIAKALSSSEIQADAFGVARLDEALALRAAGIVKPIVLLEGFFNTDDIDTNVVHTEGAGLAIGGTMTDGNVITFSYGLYNDNSSFNNMTGQLWNLTDGVLLNSETTTVLGSTHINYVPVDVSFTYTVTAADDGDTLQLRFVERGNSTARDIYVDNYSVSSAPVPEPTSTALLGLGGLALILRRRKN